MVAQLEELDRRLRWADACLQETVMPSHAAWVSHCRRCAPAGKPRGARACAAWARANKASMDWCHDLPAAPSRPSRAARPARSARSCLPIHASQKRRRFLRAGSSPGAARRRVKQPARRRPRACTSCSSCEARGVPWHVDRPAETARARAPPSIFGRSSGACAARACKACAAASAPWPFLLPVLEKRLRRRHARHRSGRRE